MAHSATCSGCPECSPEMRTILAMDSRALSRLNTARTKQTRTALGHADTNRQLRTSATPCACGRHVASATPVAGATESPEARRVQARDVYGRLLAHATPTNMKAARLLTLAFPGIAEEYMQQSAPAMPNMTDRIRANAQPTVAPPPKAARGFSTPPAEPTVAYAPVRVASMTDRIKAGRKQ